MTTAAGLALRPVPWGVVMPRGLRAASDASAHGRASVRSAADAEVAVRQVYDAHYGRLTGWTTRLVDDRDLAHDLVTEAFVKLINHWAEVEEPRAWLYATVANLVRDHWRKRGREAAAYGRHQAGSSEVGQLGGQPGGHGLDPATRLTVRELVQRLPDRLRVVVLLHYYADLPVAQVARQLGKSEGTIKRDLFDARARMAAQLGERR